MERDIVYTSFLFLFFYFLSISLYLQQLPITKHTTQIWPSRFLPRQNATIYIDLAFSLVKVPPYTQSSPLSLSLSLSLSRVKVLPIWRRWVANSGVASQTVASRTCKWRIWEILYEIFTNDGWSHMVAWHFENRRWLVLDYSSHTNPRWLGCNWHFGHQRFSFIKITRLTQNHLQSTTVHLQSANVCKSN